MKAFNWIYKAWNEIDDDIIKISLIVRLLSFDYEDLDKTLKLVLEYKQAPEGVLVNKEPGDDHLIYSEDQTDEEYQDSDQSERDGDYGDEEANSGEEDD